MYGPSQATKPDPRPSDPTSVHPLESSSQWPEKPFSYARTRTLNDVWRLHAGLMPGASAFRHSGWQSDRRTIVQAFLDIGYDDDRVNRFADCGDQAYVLRRIDDPTVVRVAGSACHDRWCLPCARDRARTIAANLIDHTEGLTLRFLTLTLKHSDTPLSDQLQRLGKAFAGLRRSAAWRKRVQGGAAMIECRYDDLTRQWHPHLHCVIEGSFFPQPVIRRLWHKITGDSYIVDIRLARGHAELHRYVSKYVTKPWTGAVIREPARLHELIQALAGRRLCTTYGTWRGFCLTEMPPGDAWENLGALDEWLRKAKAGDAEAVEILSHLDDRAVGHALLALPEQPPNKSPPRDDLSWHRQYDMFDLYDAGRQRDADLSGSGCK